MSATDFCKLIHEAPLRELEKVCSAADKKTKRYRVLAKRARNAAEICWSALNEGVKAGRVQLVPKSAELCAAALTKLGWEKALSTPVETLAACREATVGRVSEGEGCTASVECREGLFCMGGKWADATCTKQLAKDAKCPPAENMRHIADESACQEGLFCDHGGPFFLPDPPPLSPGLGRPQGRPPRPRPVPVKFGKPTIVGSLAPEVVQRVIRSRRAQFRHCYDQERKITPDLGGQLTMQFVISRAGTVSAATGTGGRVHKGVIKCFANLLYGVTFPAPKGGIARVTYPLELVAGRTKKKEGDKEDGATSLGSPTLACVAKKNAGEACRATRECAARLVCDGNECRPSKRDDRGVAGAECKRDADCRGVCTEDKCASFCGAG